MSLADFNNVAKTDQLSYLLALFGGMGNINDFTADEYRASQDKNDLLPATVSVANTPQEILTSAYTLRRLAFALSGLDRQKASIIAFDRDSASPDWQNLSTALAKDPQGMTGAGVAYEGLVPFPTIVSAGDVGTVPGSDYKYRDITFDYQGVQSTKRFYLDNFTYQNQSLSWWVQE